MESSPPKTVPPTRKNLENYAISYMGAYLNTVKKERPEHVPALARNQFYEIEVCLLPNGCLSMLFERAEKQNVAVGERNWDYVESKALSGVAHMVAVYPHEGVTVADAIARGKKDAVRDIRSLEESNIAKAVTQLEKLIEGMTSVERGNKALLQAGEQELAKLKPIKDAIMSSGPEPDMLAMIDALKNYTGSSAPSPGLWSKERELLESLVRDLGDLSDVIRRAEAQDKRLEELEQATKKALSELNRTVDERVSKGLAVILSASDKKIDKGFAALAGIGKKDVMFELPKELEVRLDNLEKAVRAAQMQLQELPVKEAPRLDLPKDLELRLERLDKAAEALQTQLQERQKRQPAEKLSDEVVLAVADLKENVARINQRITKIEEYIVNMTNSQPAVRQRVLKQK